MNHVATQEVAQVKVGQEVLPRSRSSVGNLNFVVLTCCSRFPMFAGCFTLEVAIFFSMIFVRMSPIQTKTNQTFLLRQTLKPQTQTVAEFLSCDEGFDDVFDRMFLRILTRLLRKDCQRVLSF